ncbi:MAG: SDR family oxidoreductase [Acidobacteriota bacterium]|nr:SDR family oxidoreductase [Acidobacteriota bacterium]
MTGRQRVAVVTGGGGGIGAAIAEELGRRGWFVVPLDPMVTLDGSERLPEPEETTAGRIVAAGGAARQASVSVTDGEAVDDLFESLAREHGGLDAVVNVAGITRQTGFAHGTEEDWLAVLGVHLGGYLHVLRSALPLMTAAGSGRIVGVTSGSGWRPADAGAYSAAKRVVAALTWELGRLLPTGVAVNAVSPIAATRMVAAAIDRAKERARTGGRGGSGGGLSLAGMPGPADLAPFGAHLLEDGFGWCTGQVLFTGGSEVALVGEPRLMEVVRTGGIGSLRRVLGTVVPRAFARAETAQATDGGGNPRFGGLFDEPEAGSGGGGTGPRDPGGTGAAVAEVRTCALVTDRPALGEALAGVLGARGLTCHRLDTARGFGPAAAALRSLVEARGPVDAVVVAAGAETRSGADGGGWERVLAEHAGIVDGLGADGAWARAVADYALEASRPVHLVTLTEATTAGGRSRAQAAVQLARVGPASTEGRVAAFGVSLEAPEKESAVPAAELVGALLTDAGAAPLAGAELVVGPGWVGLRSHPRPLGSITYGGPAVPVWLDDALREMAGAGSPRHDGGDHR